MSKYWKFTIACDNEECRVYQTLKQPDVIPTGWAEQGCIYPDIKHFCPVCNGIAIYYEI